MGENIPVDPRWLKAAEQWINEYYPELRYPLMGKTHIVAFLAGVNWASFNLET